MQNMHGYSAQHFNNLLYDIYQRWNRVDVLILTFDLVT